MPALQSILVPVDGSPASLAALDHAIALAEDLAAKLELLEVIPDAAPRAGVAGGDPGAVDTAFDRARSALGERVSRRTVRGEPVATIIAAAAQRFELIVMGTSGRVGRLHEVLGSVAEGVVRNAPCPVLTVRDSRTGYQSFADRRHHRPSVADQAGRVPH